MIRALLTTLLLLTFLLQADDASWPKEVQDIQYPSKADNTKQPALWYETPDTRLRPLMVGLHTWSSDYKQKSSVPYAKWCMENKWHFIHPNFRGPNKTPEAMGSELAVQDILSAVDYAKSQANVDHNRIYLIGCSGGGHATMLMMGRYPKKWAGATAWVGISDIAAWHDQTSKADLRYAKEIEIAAGGAPKEGSDAEAECIKRSPLTYLPKAKGQIGPFSINVGIHDGHTGSVPVSQSLNAFNALADEKDRFSAKQIRFITSKQRIPKALRKKITLKLAPLFEEKPVLLHRKSGNVEITIFDGGHEILYAPALDWIGKQSRRGGHGGK